MFDLKIFGERLRLLRKEKGLVMTDICDLLGVSSAQISDMENGKTGTTMARLVVLADFYGVSTDYLLGRTDDPTWRGEEEAE